MIIKQVLILACVSLLASTSFATTGTVAGPKPLPPIVKQVTPGRPFVDACGNTVSVSEGSVSVTLDKIKSGPNAGKKCITKVAIGADDNATITIVAPSQIEVLVIGAGKVTINADDQGEKDAEDRGDSKPGIRLTGDGKGESSVTVNGNGNVIGVGGKKHCLSVQGNSNWVLPSGGGHKMSLSGTGNTIYS